MTTSFCQCGSPWIAGDKCDRCGKQISPERLDVLAKVVATEGSAGMSSNPKSAKNTVDFGYQAALRVRKYGTLWDQIGTIINILNSIGVAILLILLLISGLDGKFILLGIVIIAVIWMLSYLQISIVKGLASYFQMKSADYLERKGIDK